MGMQHYNAWSYSRWVDAQAEKILAEKRELSRRGIFDTAVWFTPTDLEREGFLTCAASHVKPEGATECVSWRHQGARFGWVPNTDVRSLIFDLFHHASIIPTLALERL